MAQNNVNNKGVLMIPFSNSVDKSKDENVHSHLMKVKC